MRRSTEGEIYSIHSPGVSVVVLPGFAVAGYGGAVATVIAEAALAVTLLAFVRASIPLEFKGIGAIALAAVPAAAVGVLVFSVAHPLLAAAAASLVYAGALLAVRQFPPELMIAVRSRTRRQR